MFGIHPILLAILWSLTGIAGLNYGTTITFTAPLSGTDENPPTGFPGTGLTAGRLRLRGEKGCRKLL